MLTDKFGRIHNYLRISLTDKCNLRCNYCMPDVCSSFLTQDKIMTAQEIEHIAVEFIKLGVNKIRLTGGEPLVRNDFEDIVRRLSKYNIELLLTTNGVLIDKYFNSILAAGITSVNVSLDSLNRESFFKITHKDKFNEVWRNILLLLKHNFRVKLNVVAVNGVVEKEIFDFIGLTKELSLHVRFIEFMPFAGNKWSKNKVVTSVQMLKWVEQSYDIIKLKDEPHATSKKYKVVGHEGTFAFITTMSEQFCGECNRIRLTADGKMKNCLFGKDEIELLTTLRKGDSIIPLIIQSVNAKHAALGGQFDNNYNEIVPDKIINRGMFSIGG